MKRGRGDELPDESASGTSYKGASGTSAEGVSGTSAKGASGKPDFVSDSVIKATFDVSPGNDVEVEKSHAVFYKFSIDEGLQFLIAHCYQGYKFNNIDRQNIPGANPYSDLLSPNMIHKYNDYFDKIKKNKTYSIFDLTEDKMVIRKMGRSYIFTSPKNTCKFNRR